MRLKKRGKSLSEHGTEGLHRGHEMSTVIYTPTKAKQGDRITDNFMDIWEYLVTVQIRINSLQAGLFQ